MSTTVIASRHGARLHVLPAGTAPLDVDAVRRVLARHGLGLVEGAELPTANEFIAAQDLDPAAAGRLAEDLRAIGLTVRVVNRTGLTTSNRMALATSAHAAIGLAGVMALSAGAIGLAEGNVLVAAAMLALGVVASGLSLTNIVSLLRSGGNRLLVAGTTSEAPLLTEKLADLSEGLPEHLAEPLLERARRLEAHARQDPEGEAARELQQLVDELGQSKDQAAADEARELRAELARARRAMKETQGR
ncbi:MAG: hypothetical protein GY913_18965 [Proteobacteria bacterium]|nr:hypothetical protein [Pseudomonadota bacterium]MCP4918991.1 hypothetical protein [Pseudomonadota bacterium]